MQDWEHKGDRIGLLVGAIGLATMAVLFVLNAISVGGSDGDIPLAASTLFFVCCLLIGLWYVKLPDHINVHKSGTIAIDLGYVRGNIHWSGTRNDVESLEYQTYETGEGDLKYTVLAIKGKGLIALVYLNFDEAKEMANAIGIELRETKVQEAPYGQWRKDLLARLG